MARRRGKRANRQHRARGKSQPQPPQVSIVVVNHEANHYLARAAESILRQVKRIAYELVVVDTSLAPRPLEAAPARLHWMASPPGSGFAAAANVGVRASTAPYVLLLNPDTELQNDAVSALVGYLESHPRVGIAAPKLVNPDGSLQLSCRSFPSYSTGLFHRYSLLTRWLPQNRFTRRYLLTDWNHDSVRSVDWVSGACLMVRRKVFDTVGLLDESFFLYAEDVDLCYRARQAGWDIVYIPSGVVLHHIGGSSQFAPARAIRERHRSMWTYYRKHLAGSPLLDLVAYAGIQLRCAYHLARLRMLRSR
jgi:hypothetical protein